MEEISIGLGDYSRVGRGARLRPHTTYMFRVSPPLLTAPERGNLRLYRGHYVLRSPWLGLIDCLRFGLKPNASVKDYSAAVNVIITLCPDPRVVMVEKALRKGDPWSGDMAFPGGRREDGDRSPIDTAIRETLEEACLEPTSYSVLGFLNTASPRNAPWLQVVPVVSFAKNCPKDVLANCRSTEIARVTLVPLPRMLTTQLVLHPIRGRLVEAYRDWYGNIVWGMSLRVLQSLLGILYGCKHWPGCASVWKRVPDGLK